MAGIATDAPLFLMPIKLSRFEAAAKAPLNPLLAEEAMFERPPLPPEIELLIPLPTDDEILAIAGNAALIELVADDDIEGTAEMAALICFSTDSEPPVPKPIAAEPRDPPLPDVDTEPLFEPPIVNDELPLVEDETAPDGLRAPPKPKPNPKPLFILFVPETDFPKPNDPMGPNDPNDPMGPSGPFPPICPKFGNGEYLN